MSNQVGKGMWNDMQKTIVTQACIGLFVWLISFRFLEIDTIERLVLFAILVTVPLTLGLTETTDRSGNLFKTYRLAVYAYPVAALLAFFSFFYPQGTTAGMLSLGWLLWTLVVTLYGVFRLLARGYGFLEETCLDIGLIYIVIGGGWFVISQMGIQIMDFSPLIIRLTAIHFHYSAFVAPIFCGLLGRILRQRDGRLTLLYRLAARGIVISPIGIAVGMTYSRYIEFIFVTLFVVCLWLYAYVTVITVRKMIRNRFAHGLLALSSGSLLLTMLFAAYYGLGRLLRIELVSIPDMVWLHGLGNAFGFVFLGVIGWLVINPDMHRNPYGMPYSRFYGKWRIGADFFQRHGFVTVDRASPRGLVDDMGIFQNKNFQLDQVHPEIRSFYEQTLNYCLVSKTFWQRGFRTLSRLYKKFSASIEQINLPLSHEGNKQVVESKIIPLDSKKDGRRDVRAWIRTAKQTQEAV